MEICRICHRPKREVTRDGYRVDKNGFKKITFSCKKCNALRARNYRKTERGKEVYREIMRRQYLKHRHKILCRRALNTALAQGKIRKDRCANCSSFKTEAHHFDYKKPLEVTWLCRQCHALLHHSLVNV